MDLHYIASKFALEGQAVSVEPLGEGFINDTFVVRTAGETPDYILQRKNKAIFKDVPGMMENIRKVTEHMRLRVAEAGGDVSREVMRVVPAVDGRLYHIDSAGDFWAVSEFISGTVAYNRADSPDLARKGGEGIGKFQALLSDFTEPLAETIKGFHNIRHRFEQWDEAVARDAAGRIGAGGGPEESGLGVSGSGCTGGLAEEISWIESRREEMMGFWSRVESGEIPMRVTHNDTKISNILFDADGSVLCAIDLDTVMSSTALNDFGDAIRSYCNTGDEDDRDLDRVGLSLDMFRAYTEGYLSYMGGQLTESELAWLAFSARYITFEQVLRFLMDYIDGDTYYKIKYPEHNLVRAKAQYKLLQSMEEQYEEMCGIVERSGLLKN